MTALPSHVSSSGSSPSISHAPRTSSLRGISSSSINMFACDLSAISFNAIATPPLVGSLAAVILPAFIPSLMSAHKGAASDLIEVTKAAPSLSEAIAVP